jgi:DNA modification methylase
VYNRIILGGCVEGMRSLPADLVPCTVTSPPYGRIRDYHGHHEFDFEGTAAELWRITRPGGVVCWVIREEIVDGSESGEASKHRLFFRSLGFRLHQTIVMERYGSRGRSPRRYGESLEYAFILAKGKPATVRLLRDRRNKTAGKLVTVTHRYPDGSRQVGWCEVNEWGYRKAVWYYAQGMHVATDPIAFMHQAPMPEAMAEDLILSYSREGDLIFDPFAGVATTAKMALLNHRNYCGYEINPIYHARGEERLRAARMEYLSGVIREITRRPPQMPPPSPQLIAPPPRPGTPPCTRPPA